MARDKEWEARMQGMIYASNLVKEGGVEALKEDMKRRNFLRAPLNITVKQMKEHYEYVSANLYNNMLTVVCYTLNDTFGFGAKRLNDFKAAFDKNIECTLDFDYMGEHYVKLEDYAVEINEKFNMGIDIDRVSMCQDYSDENNDRFRTCKVDVVIRELQENGFDAAAAFLEQKKY